MSSQLQTQLLSGFADQLAILTRAMGAEALEAVHKFEGDITRISHYGELRDRKSVV